MLVKGTTGSETPLAVQPVKKKTKRNHGVGMPGLVVQPANLKRTCYRNHGDGTPPLSGTTRANRRTALQYDTRLSTTMAFLPRAYALSTSSNSRTAHLGPRVAAALRNMSMVELWLSVK